MRFFPEGLFIYLLLFVFVDIYLYARTSEVKKADVAIVLGAGVNKNKLSPVFEERIKHGIWLYKGGFVDKLIFTGGKGKKKEYSEASVAKEYAIKNSVPSKDIFIEEKSTITQENLFYANKILKKKSVVRVRLEQRCHT